MDAGMPENHDFIRLISKKGENQVKTWAGDLNWVASPPDEDLKGWDFLIEFDAQRTGHLDERPAGFSCRVQVKATAANRRRIPIKLDNWERMAKDSEPWFCVVLQYTSARTSPRLKAAYVVHIGEAHISKTLCRLRELGLNKDELLHKHTMDLEWTADDRLSKLTHEKFGDAIQRHLGPDPRIYRKNKEKILAEVGYDTRRHAITLQFKSKPLETQEHELVNAILGLQSQVDIEVASVSEIRFGIHREKAIYKNLTVQFSLPQDAGIESSLTLIDLDSFESARLCGRVVSSDLISPEIRPENRRNIIRGKFWDIIEGADGKISFSWDWTKPGEAPSMIELG
jgi:hypothetical protein